MNNVTIAVLDGGYASYAFERKYFESQGYQFTVFEGDRKDIAGRIQLAKRAAGILVRWTVVNNSFLNHLPDLKAVVRYGTGYDNLDLRALEQKNVRVANVQSYANHAVSDHALMMLMACLRLLPQGQGRFPDQFTKPPSLDIWEMKDLTVGIIGLGRIGGTFCQKVKGLVHKVMAVDPYISEERFNILGAEPCSINKLLDECDAISLHCNLTEETTRILDENTFNKMKKRPIIINTSRGPVLDHHALMDALCKNQVHSAGLDVYPEEPPSEDLNDLLSHSRVIATGHYAWYSEESAVELQRRAARNMIGLLCGDPVEDELFYNRLNQKRSTGV